MIVGKIERTSKGAIVLAVCGKPGLTHPLRGPGANASRFRSDIGTLKPDYVGRRIMTRLDGRWRLEPRAPLYAWRADRRATRAHIKHFVAAAVADKAWARGLSPVWFKGASQMSREMAEDHLTLSVRQLARKSMEYARMRAFMRGAYTNWPGDKPAHDFWHALTNGTPARYYDSAVGDYVERIGGAAG